MSAVTSASPIAAAARTVTRRRRPCRQRSAPLPAAHPTIEEHGRRLYNYLRASSACSLPFGPFASSPFFLRFNFNFVCEADVLALPKPRSGPPWGRKPCLGQAWRIGSAIPFTASTLSPSCTCRAPFVPFSPNAYSSGMYVVGAMGGSVSGSSVAGIRALLVQ